jgi:putative ABC transport system permease protein
MALGARQGQVVRLMLWQGLQPAVVGMVLGLGAALAGARLIRGLLYQVQPHDPTTFVMVCLALLAVVLIACAIPARRATGVAPAEALRGE